MLALLHTGLSLVDPSPAAAAQLLGVKLGSLDRATVRLAYRRAAARSHPDVSESPDAGEHFVDVTTAAQVLRTYLGQSRSATAAAARRARWSESEPESETAAAALRSQESRRVVRSGSLTGRAGTRRAAATAVGNREKDGEQRAVCVLRDAAAATLCRESK